MGNLLRCVSNKRPFLSSVFLLLSAICVSYDAIHPGALAVEDADFHLDNCVQDEFTYAADSGCRCFQFQSSPSKKFGYFNSPNYPGPYPIFQPCLLYVFVADQDEIVHLKLDQFRLKPRITNKCHDYVRLFLDSPRAELSAHDKWNYELCGSDLTQKDFYSSDRILMLEFHSEISKLYQTAESINVFAGFKGEFYFKKSAQYRPSGQLISGSKCDYEFVSDLRLRSGPFFSPGYPQNYKADTTCNYYFRALSSERIVLDFRKLNLGKKSNVSDCRMVSSKTQDVVVVFDQDSSRGNLLARFATDCPFSHAQVVSPNNYLRVKFKSNSDDVTGFGFSATFGFVEKHKLQPTAPIADGRYINDLEDIPTPVFRHKVIFDGRESNSGVFVSVNYPRVYPQSSEITYEFIGEPGQIIRIKFVHFRLDTGGSNSCHFDYQGDRLFIYDGRSPEFSKKTVIHCGSYVPDEFWSSSHYLTLVFHSDDNQTPSERGFSGNYYFIKQNLANVSPNNLQVPKDQSAVENSQPSCSPDVVTITSSKSSQGTVTTSGYPLRLGRSQCLWHLLGNRNATERLVLTIQDLDIDSKSVDVDQSIGGRCTTRDNLTVTKFIEMPGAKEDLVPVLFCEVTNSRPVRIMSTNIPKLYVQLHAQRLNPIRRGLKFSYRFVQDFGVQGTQKIQDMSKGCHFSFYSYKSINGSFTSPNFPHKYPEKVTCTYQFHARPQETIRIEFAKFGTETPRHSCIDDDSDFVYAEDCYTNRPVKSRFCGKPLPGSRYAISRQTQCLRIKFVSNDRYTSSGFLAYYFFEKYSNTIHSRLGGDVGNLSSQKCRLSHVLYSILCLTYSHYFLSCH